MITEEKRMELRGQLRLSDGLIGIDCDGKLISVGDNVLVVKKEREREKHPEHSFCDVGQRGQAIKHIAGWVIEVQFDGGSVGCADLNLQKVT
jgi:hypothetical protein